MMGALKVMKNKAFMLSFQIPNMLIDCLTNFLAYEYDILSFLIIQSLDFDLHGEKQNFQGESALTYRNKNYFFYFFF